MNYDRKHISFHFFVASCEVFFLCHYLHVIIAMKLDLTAAGFFSLAASHWPHVDLVQVYLVISLYQGYFKCLGQSQWECHRYIYQDHKLGNRAKGMSR